MRPLCAAVTVSYLRSSTLLKVLVCIQQNWYPNVTWEKLEIL